MPGIGTTRIPKVTYQVNVSDYGAKGDGVTDDTAAIQAAIDAIRATDVSSEQGWAAALVFEPGQYYISSSLDMTNIRAFNWTIVGHGAKILANCTGDPAIDLLGSRFFHISDLDIYGDSTNTPSYGIQMGRVTNNVSCGDGSLHDVKIHGKFSVTCLYNFAAETMLYSHLKLYNNNSSGGSFCLVMDASNNYDITSDFVTQTIATGTDQSFNEQLFLVADIRKETSGRAIMLTGEGMSRHTFIASYGVSKDHAVFYIEDCTRIEDLYIDMHVEDSGCDEYMLIENTFVASNINMYGLTIKDHRPQCNTALIDTTGTTRTVLLNNCDISCGDPNTTIPVFGSTAASAGKIQVTGVIKWPSTKNIDISNCKFNGILYTRESNTVTANSDSTYLLLRTPNNSSNYQIEYVGKHDFSGTLEASGTLTVSGGLFHSNMKSGTDQANAGAATNEIFYNTTVGALDLGT